MKIKEFYHEFEMLVRPSQRRLRRMKNPGYRSDVWNARIDDAVIYDISNVAEEVECVDVTMPADRLEELERLLEHYEQLEKEQKQNRYDMLTEMRRDARVRIKNPAVRQAWEHYLTLLNLCRD
jgi:hypothetical protein